MNSVQAKHVRASLESVVSSDHRFFGERVWVPYFWDLISLAGGSTRCVCLSDAWRCSCPTAIVVSEEDRSVFPELGQAGMAYVFERDDGTVGGYTDSEYRPTSG